MSVAIMDVQEALERGKQMPFALVRSLSAVSLGPSPAEVDEEDLLEARFFSAEEEIRVFRRDGTLQAAVRRETGEERFSDRTYAVSGPGLGAQITVRSYMDFDEDGQAYWRGLRLVDWKGGEQDG